MLPRYRSPLDQLAALLKTPEEKEMNPRFQDRLLVARVADDIGWGYGDSVVPAVDFVRGDGFLLSV